MNGLLSRFLPASRAQRLLIGGTAVNAIGDGVFAATGILFFTEVLELPATTIGRGLALGGLLAMLAGIPIGKLADGVGARRILIVLTVIEGAAVCMYCMIGRPASFVAVSSLAVVANLAAPGVRNAYIAREEPGPTRVRLRALLRSVTNTGLAAGGALAALVLVVSDSRPSCPAYTGCERLRCYPALL